MLRAQAFCGTAQPLTIEIKLHRAMTPFMDAHTESPRERCPEEEKICRVKYEHHRVKERRMLLMKSEFIPPQVLGNHLNFTGMS
jgi:hypothetical protein